MASTEAAIIGVDVGGTDIDAGLLQKNGSFQLKDYFRIDTGSHDNADRIISRIAGLILSGKYAAEDQGLKVAACGIGMPGPFKYKEGVSRMNGENDKFEKTYDVNFKKPLEDETELPIYFLNDADAFGLGVYAKSFPNEPRLLAITIGTGLGSAFLVDGKLRDQLPKEEQDKIPEDGIWNITTPSGRILEEYVSARTIVNAYTREAGEESDPKAIADAARRGQPEAMFIYNHLGINLGAGLVDVIEEFRPTRIVLGGQISNAFDLFGNSMKNALRDAYNGPISAAVDDNYAIYGAAQFALDQIS